jgi:hypothetical protein
MSYNLPTDSTMGGGGNNGSNNLPVGGATDTGVGTESGGGEPNTSGDGAFSGPPDPSTYTDFENPSAYTTNEFGGDSSFAGPPAPTTGGIDMPAGGDNPSEGTSDLGSSGGINQPAPVDTSSDTPYTDPNSDDTSGGGYSPPPDSSDDYSGGDYSGGDYSGGDDSSYARGGAVQNMGIPPQRGQGGGMTTGGRVPLQASPSQGQQTDDVPARLNAGEFVVPKDVAAWKGQEFFQKLIEQSRKARLGSPAKPKAKLPLPNQHQPSFISRRMPGR